ncbi:MAG TPA: SRPBCC family protein [Nocardioidaceae bacterium]|nr:SRPBCC family protein [Nocardioidaceae bacterium]
MADDTYTVQRSVAIDAPPQRIYDQVADFHNWTNWSPWEDVDPELERTYSGAESGAGAVYRWSGNRKAGQGRMEIVEADEPSRVRIDLMFEKPFKARNDTVFGIQTDGSGSRVTWSMTGKKTLMTKALGIFTSMDKMLGPDFEKGLGRLKATAEKSPG